MMIIIKIIIIIVIIIIMIFYNLSITFGIEKCRNFARSDKNY